LGLRFRTRTGEPIAGFGWIDFLGALIGPHRLGIDFLVDAHARIGLEKLIRPRLTSNQRPQPGWFARSIFLRLSRLQSVDLSDATRCLTWCVVRIDLFLAQYPCYSSGMKKMFAAALLLMVFASPVFAASHHHHRHHHHHHAHA
jgi:hypothetical protein